MSFSRMRVSSSQLDFTVIDMCEDVEVPLILGCPFLATTKTIVDVEEEKLTLRLGDERVIQRLPDSMLHTLDHDDDCFMIDVIDLICLIMCGSLRMMILSTFPFNKKTKKRLTPRWYKRL